MDFREYYLGEGMKYEIESELESRAECKNKAAMR